MSEDDQVRRLLADARHSEPLPPDVAERLDGVLADLRAERPIRPSVTDLAATRRRRRARTLLAAAVAVLVVGIGVDQLRGLEMSGGDSDSPSSASAGDDAGGSTAEREGAGDAAAEQAPPPLAGSAPAAVDADRFGSEVRRLRTRSAADALTDSAARSRCTARDAGAGDAVPIRYDGSPALLVYRAPRGDTQVVDLYICGRDEVARSITLPAP